MKISNQALRMVVGLIHNLGLRIFSAMHDLICKENHPYAITNHCVEEAAKIVFPLELRKHVIPQGTLYEILNYFSSITNSYWISVYIDKKAIRKKQPSTCQLPAYLPI